MATVTRLSPDQIMLLRKNCEGKLSFLVKLFCWCISLIMYDNEDQYFDCDEDNVDDNDELMMRMRMGMMRMVMRMMARAELDTR